MRDHGPLGVIGLRELVAPLVLHRRWVLPLALALLASFAYFVPAPAWNQNSRFALTRALVERGSTQIDPDHETTGDKSFFAGHFYCDKAPGASLLATVPYAVFYGLRRVTHASLPQVSVVPLDPREQADEAQLDISARKPGDRLSYNAAHRIALYLCSVVAIGIPSVCGALALWLLALRLGGRPQLASGCALLYGIATPALPYSTTLYGHQLCGALLLIGFALTILPEPRRCSVAASVLTGGVLSFAVVTEYPAVVPAALLGLIWLWRHGLPRLPAVILGALGPALLLAAYHTAAFGHPLRTGYDYVWLPEFAEGMEVRYGLGRPSLRVLLAITFGSYRGLFYLSPVLLLACWGLLTAAPTPGRWATQAKLGAFGIILWFFGLNASYYMWDGGAALGPRHVIPCLGFMALGLVVALHKLPQASSVIGLVSAAQMAIATAAMPEAPQWGDPLWEHALGQVLDRPAASNTVASNLGLLLGLPGLWSLAPLFALWWWAWPTMDDRPSVRIDPPG